VAPPVPAGSGERHSTTYIAAWMAHADAQRGGNGGGGGASGGAVDAGTGVQQADGGSPRLAPWDGACSSDEDALALQQYQGVAGRCAGGSGVGGDAGGDGSLPAAKSVAAAWAESARASELAAVVALGNAVRALAVPAVLPLRPPSSGTPTASSVSGSDPLAQEISTVLHTARSIAPPSLSTPSRSVTGGDGGGGVSERTSPPCPSQGPTHSQRHVRHGVVSILPPASPVQHRSAFQSSTASPGASRLTAARLDNRKLQVGSDAAE
jgi:hypothetical protein